MVNHDFFEHFDHLFNEVKWNYYSKILMNVQVIKVAGTFNG